jgi:hypothetical protein
MALLIRPGKRLKKAKSKTSQEVLDRLKSYLESTEVTGEPVKVLCGFWKDQQNAITYQELREAVKSGEISSQTLRDWQQDYSVLVSEKLSSMWTKAIEAGPSGQPLMDGLAFEFNTQSTGILNWIKERGAAFVTASTEEQKNAIATLLTQKMRESHTVDELARMIRPCIGLTEGQAAANAKYYDSIVSTLTKEHPRMSASSIRQKALDASQKYAERQHRQRALTIAQTESAFAYNRGADEGIRQAQEQSLLGEVKKVWSTSGDDAVCEICAALEGMEIGLDDTFNYRGKLLFPGQKMLPPAHPRCACAIEYIEVSKPQIKEDMFESETLTTQQDSLEAAQAEYDRTFEGQTLDAQTYKDAAVGMAELDYNPSAERVVEMVNSVNEYTGGDYTDILAAQANFEGRFAGYSGTMTQEAREAALQNLRNIEEFIDNSPAYQGKVYRGLGFDVGGEYDDGSYDAFRNLYKKGSVVETDTLTSWTKDESFLSEVHAYRTGIDEECEYSVEVTIRMKNCETGVDIEKYSQVQGQKEVLFNKTSLKVLDVKENWKDDELLQLIIDVEEM